MNPVRVLIIEDNPVLREGIRDVLHSHPEFSVVEALETADSLADRLRDVDAVLLDLGLRSQNSLDVVDLCHATAPTVRVLVMGLFPTYPEILDHVKRGVDGFLLKDATPSDFHSAIRSVMNGDKVLPPFLTDSLFTQIVKQHAADPSGLKKLRNAIVMTPREKDVIGLIGAGLTNKEIAQRLSISEFTVKSHVHNILEKLTLHNRLQIANYSHDR